MIDIRDGYGLGQWVQEMPFVGLAAWTALEVVILAAFVALIILDRRGADDRECDAGTDWTT